MYMYVPRTYGQFIHTENVPLYVVMLYYPTVGDTYCVLPVPASIVCIRIFCFHMCRYFLTFGVLWIVLDVCLNILRLFSLRLLYDKTFIMALLLPINREVNR